VGSRWIPGIRGLGSGGGPPPPETTDHFAPKYIVGNVLAGDPAVAQAAPFVYIPDPGDGSGIEAAFAAAAIAPGDVWIRPGIYDLRIGAVASLTQPTGVLCRGAGIGSTFIFGRATGNQTILTMGAAAQLRDIQVLSGAPTAATAGPSLGVIEAGLGAVIQNCLVALSRSTDFDRTQTIAIRYVAVNGRELVVDTRILIDSLNAQPTPAASQAIVFGDGVAGFSSLRCDSEVRDVFIDEITPGAGSSQKAVLFQNVSGGRCFNVEHANARTPVFGSFLWSWSFASSDPIIRAPKFIQCRMEAIDDQTQSPLAGIVIAVFGAPGIAAAVGLLLDGCVMRFTPAENPVAATDLNGYVIVNSAEDESGIIFGQISDCTAFFSVQGFLIDASGEGQGPINDLRFTGCIESTPVDGHTTQPRGMRIRGVEVNQNSPRVNDIGIVNCDFRPNGQGAVGIEIDGDTLTLGVQNTIVSSNTLRARNGAVALLDNGTGTQSGLNTL
jgi:hypothetical protein